MHFSNIQIKKKKKSTYRPSQFSGQKFKQTFISLGLIGINEFLGQVKMVAILSEVSVT